MGFGFAALAYRRGMGDANLTRTDADVRTDVGIQSNALPCNGNGNGNGNGDRRT
ncbi:MAG: hypothetical protein RIR79_566 [Pseudomonadota bacterium]